MCFTKYFQSKNTAKKYEMGKDLPKIQKQISMKSNKACKILLPK
jgi:hypothetical protein